jgi:hypothetical protein
MKQKRAFLPIGDGIQVQVSNVVIQHCCFMLQGVALGGII